MNHDHEEIRELLGAYALDAVSPLEHRRVTKHIEGCADCAREARLLQEAAVQLAVVAGDADSDGLVDRIVADLPSPRRRTWLRVATAGIAAAALVAVGFLGSAWRNESNRSDRLVDVIAAADHEVRLQPQEGFSGRGVVYVADEQLALVLEDVPSPGPGRSYQLWSIGGGDPNSVTVVDGGGRMATVVAWRGPGSRFAVTVEPDGGSVRPTTAPVLVGA
jgi:hypothetical protein